MDEPVSLHSFNNPWKILSPQTAYGIIYSIANIAASRIRSAPEIIRDWNVERIFSISVISLKARSAFKDLVNRLNPPINIKLVVTFTISPIRMKKSNTFQILRIYALGVNENPSATSLIINSTKSMSPKVVSAISNHDPLICPCSA